MAAILSSFWIILASVYFYLAFIHWRYANEDIRAFHLHENKSESADTESSELIKSFVTDFNLYLERANRQNRLKHRGATIGYAVAGILAVASLILVQSL